MLPGARGLHPTKEPLQAGARADAGRLGRKLVGFRKIGEEDAMKKALWWVGGFCAAAAGFLVLGARRVPPVEALARASDEREIEEAWKENHTVV